jgi:hypothetical protein
MKKSILIAILLLATHQLYAQMMLETLAGNEQAHYINYFDKDLDSSEKWNFFNLNRFTVNYKDKTLNTVSIEGQLSYQLKPWLGISAGGGFYGAFFIPTFGLSLSYLNKNEDFFIQMYPTIGLAERQIAPSALGIIGYSPKFNKSWGLSSQIIFSVDPLEASQIVRIGASFKDKFQFGIGIDMLQTIQSKNFNYNSGPFIRFGF